VQENSISAIRKELRQLTAEVALLKAQSKHRRNATSPWLPLKDAASRLNYSSARALRNRIKSGHFPPDCYCIDPTGSARAPKYLIHVERYIKLLR
jgi:hypothetical protein